MIQITNFSDWTWNTKDDLWETSYNSLRDYSRNNGDLSIPNDLKDENGTNLYSWMTTQRINKSKGKLSKDRIHKLEKLQGWAWNTRDEKWFVGFRHFDKISKDLGPGLVISEFITSDGYKLGNWINVQRTLFKKNKLRKDRFELLDKHTLWVWEVGTGNYSR